MSKSLQVSKKLKRSELYNSYEKHSIFLIQINDIPLVLEAYFRDLRHSSYWQSELLIVPREIKPSIGKAQHCQTLCIANALF